MNNGEAITRAIHRLRQTATIVAIAGIVFCLALYVIGPGQFLHAYMYGYIFWLGLTIGFFGLQLLINVTRSHWGRPLLRIAEAGGGPAMLVVMFVLILPLLLGAEQIYPWAQETQVKLSAVLRYRSGYMNGYFVWIRTVFWFACWIFIAYLLRSWSLRQDKTGEMQLGPMRTNLAAGGMVVFFLTVTFAMTDWVMSLEPAWSSTVFGALMITGQMLNALAWTAILMSYWQRHAPYAEYLPTMEKPIWNDLANLLLTNVMFWAYLSLSQLLIIWSGNLPDEITYYGARGLNAWRPVSAFLIIGQFFAPFLFLLAPRTKNPSLLRKVALWILVMRVTDVFWVIVPSFGPDFDCSLQFIAECAVALLAVGGIWFTVFTSQLRQANLIPNHVYPVEEEVLEHA